MSQEPRFGVPPIDPAAPLIFVINTATGTTLADAQRELIETALKAAGRTGELVFSEPTNLAMAAQHAAFKAAVTRTAVVAVGGDGTINTVSQAAHAEGCVMGVIPRGTFNYFARTHGIGTDMFQAVQTVLHSAVAPVQVAAVNKHVFLVNASLGFYPILLEDRESYKARFGRSRLVAFGAAFMTLLRVHRQLRLHIESGSVVRDVRTTTLFVGNNRLQLLQLGVQAGTDVTSSHDTGRVAAVMLRPIGTLAMLGVMLRGAMGSLGDADSVESFEFEHMVVRPRLALDRRKVKVAVDGEVRWMRWPLEFEVHPTPLYLLKPDTALSASTMLDGAS